MAVRSMRTPVYKLGVGLLFLGSVCYIAGFASPFWYEIKYKDMHVYSGLWMGCAEVGGEKRCMSSIQSGMEQESPAWFKAVQGLESVGVVCLAVACVYAVIANVPRTPVSNTRLLEALSASGGVSGFIGGIIFVGEMTDLVPDTVPVTIHFSWSFGLSIAGCVLLLITAPIIYTANRRDPATPDLVVLPGAEISAGTSVQQDGLYSTQDVPPKAEYLAQPVYGHTNHGFSAPVSDPKASNGY